jgi:hypothetical protein
MVYLIFRFPNALAPDWCYLLPGSTNTVPSWQLADDPTCHGPACFPWFFAQHTSAISELAVSCSYKPPASRTSSDIQSDMISIHAIEDYASLYVNAQLSLYDPIAWTDPGIALSYTSGDPCRVTSVIPGTGTASAATQTRYQTHNSCYCASSISDLVKSSITGGLAASTTYTSGPLSGSSTTVYATQWIDPAVSVFEKYCSSINAGVTYPIATGTSSSTNSTAIPAPVPSPKGLSTGAKVGIGLGVPLGVAALVGLLFAIKLGLLSGLGGLGASSVGATGSGGAASQGVMQGASGSQAIWTGSQGAAAPASAPMGAWSGMSASQGAYGAGSYAGTATIATLGAGGAAGYAASHPAHLSNPYNNGHDVSNGSTYHDFAYQGSPADQYPVLGGRTESNQDAQSDRIVSWDNTPVISHADTQEINRNSMPVIPDSRRESGLRYYEMENGDGYSVSATAVPGGDHYDVGSENPQIHEIDEGYQRHEMQ